MKQNELLHEFAFEQLPLDDEVYVVVDMFHVEIERSSQPSWYVKLEALGRAGKKRRFLKYPVHGTFLHKFILGELFKNQIRIGSIRQQWDEVIDCDLEFQSIVFRPRQKGLKFSSRRISPSDIPYVKIPFIGNLISGYAFIRCHEVFRFYYGPRLSILECIYEFTDSGMNPKLYNAKKTFLSKKNQVHIFSGPKVHQGDARYLGNYIYDPRKPKAIARPAISARVQNLDPTFKFIQPITLAPIWYLSAWEVDAQLLEYEEDGISAKGLMISCLKSCGAQPLYQVFDYKPSTKKGNKRPDESYLKKKKKRKLKHSKITNAPFGDDIIDDTPIKFDEHASQPGFASMEYTKVLDGEKDDQSGKYQNVDSNGNKKSSTSNQGGGDPNTDQHNPNLRNSTNSNYEADEEQEADRTHLPSLFDTDLDRFIEGAVLPSHDTPPAINRLKTVVKYLNKHTELRAFMVGDERGDLGYDRTAVLTMPNDWLSQSGKPTYNSALGAVIIAQYKHHLFYFFELVQNFDQLHYMQAMFFPGRMSKLDIFEMSVIFHEKLKAKNHWPQRKEFCDDFYASRLRHMKAETTFNFANRMRNHAIDYLAAG